ERLRHPPHRRRSVRLRGRRRPLRPCRQTPPLRRLHPRPHHLGHLLGTARRRIVPPRPTSPQPSDLTKPSPKTPPPRTRLRLSAHIRSTPKSYGWNILRKNRGRGALLRDLEIQNRHRRRRDRFAVIQQRAVAPPLHSLSRRIAQLRRPAHRTRRNHLALRVHNSLHRHLAFHVGRRC